MKMIYARHYSNDKFPELEIDEENISIEKIFKPVLEISKTVQYVLNAELAEAGREFIVEAVRFSKKFKVGMEIDVGQMGVAVYILPYKETFSGEKLKGFSDLISMCQNLEYDCAFRKSMCIVLCLEYKAYDLIINGEKI